MESVAKGRPSEMRRVPMSPGPGERDARGSELERPAPKKMPIDLGAIREAIEGIRFGEVRIDIRDGVITQFDRLEKLRII
jgi:hypothetical protein